MIELGVRATVEPPRPKPRSPKLTCDLVASRGETTRNLKALEVDPLATPAPKPHQKARHTPAQAGDSGTPTRG